MYVKYNCVLRDLGQLWTRQRGGGHYGHLRLSRSDLESQLRGLVDERKKASNPRGGQPNRPREGGGGGVDESGEGREQSLRMAEDTCGNLYTSKRGRCVGSGGVGTPQHASPPLPVPRAGALTVKRPPRLRAWPTRSSLGRRPAAALHTISTRSPRDLHTISTACAICARSVCSQPLCT